MSVLVARNTTSLDTLSLCERMCCLCVLRQALGSNMQQEIGMHRMGAKGVTERSRHHFTAFAGDV